MALGARFSLKNKLVLRCPDFSEAARYYLKEDLEHICIENVQACILIAEYAGAHSETSTEAMYFGIAARMAQMLQLNADVEDASSIDREIRHRVWSSCYMIDVWSSAGLGISRQLDRTFIPPFIMTESQFQDTMPASEIPELINPTPGLWAHMIRLARIFIDVQEFHRRLLEPGGNDSEIDLDAAGLSSGFDQYLADLPSDATLSDENLKHHVRNGTCQTVVALHLGYHHYATLLYFHYLDRASTDSDQRSHFADRCKHHAAALSDIVKLSMERPACEARYHIVGHMTTISSSVLLYTLLFGQERELEAARTRLHANFAKLIELSRFWPGTDRFKTRLLLFQDACMWAIDPRTHKIDKWMLKFLLNHALSLPRKHTEPLMMEGRYALAKPDATMLENRTTITSQAFSTLLLANEG